MPGSARQQAAPLGAWHDRFTAWLGTQAVPSGSVLVSTSRLRPDQRCDPLEESFMTAWRAPIENGNADERAS